MKRATQVANSLLLTAVGFTTLVAFLLVISIGLSSSSFAQGVISEKDIAPFRDALNRIAEAGPIANLTNEQAAKLRSDVCVDLSKASIAKIALEIVRNAGKLFPPDNEEAFKIANTGDDFSKFLVWEGDLLKKNNFSPRATELSLNLLVYWRRFAAVDRTRFSLREDQAPSLENLLCSEERSPARNESNASWRAWGWAATKIIGGLAIAAADAAAAVGSSGTVAAFAAVSGWLGLTIASSGQADAAALLNFDKKK